MIAWKDETPPTVTRKSTFTLDGFDGFVRDGGSWFIFGKLAGYNVMASGDARNMEAAKATVETAITKLRNAGMAGR